MRHREELRERHQVALVVPAGLLSERQHRVVVARLGLLAFRAQHAHHQRRAVRTGFLVEVGDVGHQVVGEVRGRGLGPDDEARAEHLLGEGLVEFQRVVTVALEPLLVLRDGALHHRHRHRRPRGLRPQVPVEGGAGEPGEREHDARDAPLRMRAEQQRHQGAGAHEQQCAQAVHTHERRKACQPAVGLRITERQPGKSREEPAAPPFHEQPRGGQPRSASARARARAASARAHSRARPGRAP